MKKALVVALSLLAIADGAQAKSIKPTSQARLDRVQIDARHQRFAGAISAEVVVNHAYDNIRLAVNVVRPMLCVEGAECGPIAPIAVELPLVRRYEDQCGSYHWEAQTAEMIPGATIERLLVTDNRGNRCPTFVALPETEVRYTTDAPYPGYGGPYTSTFSGERLH